MSRKKKSVHGFYYKTSVEKEKKKERKKKTHTFIWDGGSNLHIVIVIPTTLINSSHS